MVGVLCCFPRVSFAPVLVYFSIQNIKTFDLKANSFSKKETTMPVIPKRSEESLRSSKKRFLLVPLARNFVEMTDEGNFYTVRMFLHIRARKNAPHNRMTVAMAFLTR
jgi:hypothetical protein